MADTLPYSCPHCNRVLHIKTDLIGEEVTCLHCDRMFEVPHPHARPMRHKSGEQHTPPDELTVSDISDPERTLEVVHPAMFRARPFAFLAWLVAAGSGMMLLTFGLAGQTVSWGPINLGGQILLIVGAGVALVSLGVLAIWWIRTRFRTLTVTNQRITYQEGLIARRTSELRHDDVRNMKVDQSFLQRICGVGRLAISSSGQDDMEIVARNIPAPEHIVQIIRARQ